METYLASIKTNDKIISTQTDFAWIPIFVENDVVVLKNIYINDWTQRGFLLKYNNNDPGWNNCFTWYGNNNNYRNNKSNNNDDKDNNNNNDPGTYNTITIILIIIIIMIILILIIIIIFYLIWHHNHNTNHNHHLIWHAPWCL